MYILCNLCSSKQFIPQNKNVNNEVLAWLNITITPISLTMSGRNFNFARNFATFETTGYNYFRISQRIILTSKNDPYYICQKVLMRIIPFCECEYLRKASRCATDGRIWRVWSFENEILIVLQLLELEGLYLFSLISFVCQSQTSLSVLKASFDDGVKKNNYR